MNKQDKLNSQFLTGPDSWNRFVSTNDGPYLISGLRQNQALSLKGYRAPKLAVRDCDFTELDFSNSEFEELLIENCQFQTLILGSRSSSIYVENIIAKATLQIHSPRVQIFSLKNLEVGGDIKAAVSASGFRVIPGNLWNFEHCQNISIEDCTTTNQITVQGPIGTFTLLRSNFLNGLCLPSAKVGIFHASDSTIGFQAIFSNYQGATRFYCSNIIFSGQLDLSCDAEINAPFCETHLINCDLQGIANFNNRNFGGTCDFSGTQFRKAPKFHNCEIHQDTNFTNARFLDIKSKWAEQAYRTLKLAMNKHHAHAEEMMFFKFEMQARRYKTSWPSKALYWIYEVCSDYGQSVMRPALMLLGTFCHFLIWYWMILFNGRLDEVTAPGGSERIGKLYIFTLEHTVPFLLPVLKSADRFPTLDGSDPSALTSTLIAGHTTIAIALFFFLLLGIRNRFRLKG